MRDIKIQFNGAAGAEIALAEMVEDNKLCEQKCLINLATEYGSDPLYEERGTELLYKAVSGQIVGTNDAVHAGNFAALDTIRFITEHYPTDTLDTGTDTADLEDAARSPLDNVNVTALSMSDGVVSYGVQIEFTDGSITDTIETSIIVDK